MPVSGPLLTPAMAAAPAPPVALAPTTRPAAPSAVRATAKSKRVTVRWSAPAPNGTKKVTKYRARVYLNSGQGR